MLDRWLCVRFCTHPRLAAVLLCGRCLLCRWNLNVSGSRWQSGTLLLERMEAGSRRRDRENSGGGLRCCSFVAFCSTVGSLGFLSCGSSTFKDLRAVQSNSASTRVLPGAGSNDLVEHGCLQVQSVLLVLDLWPAATFRSTPQPRKDMEAGRGGERKMSSTAAPIS